MKSFVILVVLVACVTRGCCPESPRTEPSNPSEVLGWQHRNERSLKIQGKFLLRQNQTTDNGEIQIKLVEVLAGKQCVDAGDERHQPRVTLEFVRLRDHVVCEETFSEKGSRDFVGTRCGSNLSEFGILGIYVIGINVKEEWVFFELRG